MEQKQQTPMGPKQDIPDRFTRDFRKHKLDKIVAGEEGRKKYSARQCQVCTAHTKCSETRNICKFCVAPLHRGFVLRNTTQLGTIRLFI